MLKERFGTSLDELCKHLDQDGDGKMDEDDEMRRLFFGDLTAPQGAVDDKPRLLSSVSAVRMVRASMGLCLLCFSSPSSIFLSTPRFGVADRTLRSAAQCFRSVA